jgi:two-component system sensor histidine kinase BaeS
VVAVLITAVVALPVTIRSANAEARQALANQADVAVRIIQSAPSPDRAQARAQAVVEALAPHGVEVFIVSDGTADRPGLPERVIADVAAGQRVEHWVLRDGRAMLVEGRPTVDRAGIVLLAPSADITARQVLGRLWLALVAGLVAGVGAGALLARRLSRPLRQVAAAARQLSAGDRTVRAPTDAPAEVAAVAVALNDLAAALATSEDRQRLFLTSISHELRTPLTTMKGYAEALADGVVVGDEARQAGQTMLTESERLDRLVEDLLALARLEADDFPLEVVRVDLSSLVRTAAESWRPRCAALGIALELDVPPHPVLVPTDPGRVRQVLDGLIENAVRVVPPGAPVVLTVSSTGTDAVLEVRDGGPGLTDDDVAVAFDRGALHGRYKGVRGVGTGLGLALAYRLVVRLGGHIEAGHAPEGGARFTVRLSH